jgi:hypothetical protein
MQKIHTHPAMEKELGVPDGHCIIDRDTFKRIVDNDLIVQNYTRSKLSKLLAENGCELESECWLRVEVISDEGVVREDIVDAKFAKKENDNMLPRYRKFLQFYPAYDLIWDICCKYAKEFFGNGLLTKDKTNYSYTWLYHPMEIVCLLQQNKKDEAENYIWLNCLFNPKNKK